MSDRHTIRLWGPWQVQAAPANDKLATHESRLNFKSLDTDVASPWTSDFGRDFVGTLTLMRKFNCPTGLEPRQKVTLETGWFDPTCNGNVIINDSHEMGPVDGSDLQVFELDLNVGPNQIDLVYSIQAGLTNFRLPPFTIMQLCIDG